MRKRFEQPCILSGPSDLQKANMASTKKLRDRAWRLIRNYAEVKKRPGAPSLNEEEAINKFLDEVLS